MMTYNNYRRDLDVYPSSTPKQSLANREAVKLSNLTDLYNVHLLQSYNNTDSAYVTRFIGTVGDAFILSKCQIYLDEFNLLARSQTRQSTSCFRTDSLNDMNKIVLVQAPKTQTELIVVHDHITTNNPVPLPQVLVACINTEAKLPPEKELAKKVLTQCLALIIHESDEFASSVIDRVFQKVAACIDK